MNNSANTEQFVKDYIEAWSTKDDATRKKLIAKVYSDTADFYANEPGDGPVERHGLQEIFDNITQVNTRLVQGKGLITESTGFAFNHDTLKVSWQMMTPDGNIAMTGMNVLRLDATAKILQDFIFIG